MKPFIQFENQQSTIENWKQILTGNHFDSFAAFAYVTDSGVAQLATHLNSTLGASRKCRWVFGLDYGRSHPAALRRLERIGKSEVRIFDGEYVVRSKAFAPRVNFHLKTALTLKKCGTPCMQIVGSGNLSASGLLSGIEAGCIINYENIDSREADAVMPRLERIWEEATPLGDLIDDYEALYADVTRPVVLPPNLKSGQAGADVFWIDVGYVTKNRGPFRPGNQFDLPRGSHVLLGAQEIKNPELNSLLAEVNIRTPLGKVVTRSLRYGNNAMEKLSLPIPEEHGYESYDGKILVFQIEADTVLLEALEHSDFFQVYGKRISSSCEMQSGRRYGTALLT